MPLRPTAYSCLRILPVAAFLWIASPGALRAQEGVEPAEQAQHVLTIAERSAKAIEAYEAIKGDPKKRRLANKQLLWLGEIEHESVTEYLTKALEAAKGSAEQIAILAAIGRSPRPVLEQRVWRLLHRKGLAPTVRQSAAAALLTMGGRALDRIHRMLRKGSEAASEAVVQACVRAIVASRDPAAIRGLLPLFDGGTSEEKLRFLRMIDSVRGVPEISRLRMRLISRGSQIMAAVAWRQLAEEGDSRAPDLVIDVLERIPDGASPAIAAELIPGLAIIGDSDFYPLLLRFGAMPGRAIKQALRRAAPFAAKDQALLRYLARAGLESKRPGERDVALVLLQHAPAEAIQPLLSKVRKALRRPNKSSLDLALALHDLLAKDPTWKLDVERLAASPTATVRTVGLSLLIELGCGDAVEIAQQSLANRRWELRSVALRYLSRFRDASSIPLLIARVGKEEGRLAVELDDALFAHTGTRCYKRSEWSSWWRKNKEGFRLPHENTVRAGATATGGRTAAYHGIPLVSKKVAFLIDTSGSMGARVGTDRKRTRLDLAKEELRKVLDELPSDFEINLISYQSRVVPVWDRLRAASKQTKREIRKQLATLRPAGGTNIYGALEQAFRDPDVDTIYLLTDGEPSAGELVYPDEIVEEIERWNHLRQIVIHCIGLGIDTKLLARLAEVTGGVYKYVR